MICDNVTRRCFLSNTSHRSSCRVWLTNWHATIPCSKEACNARTATAVFNNFIAPSATLSSVVVTGWLKLSNFHQTGFVHHHLLLGSWMKVTQSQCCIIDWVKQTVFSQLTWRGCWLEHTECGHVANGFLIKRNESTSEYVTFLLLNFNRQISGVINKIIIPLTYFQYCHMTHLVSKEVNSWEALNL